MPPAHRQADATAGGQKILRKKGTPGSLAPGWERGRRRTRQDQISLWNLGQVGRRTGEIANHLRSAPNEENQFLLPDRPLAGAGSLKRRSSRLT
jgi:hypothetical protein